MKNKLILSIIALLLAFCSNNAWSQSQKYKEGDLVKIGLKNGQSYTGYIKSFTDEEIVLEIPDVGEIIIHTANIGTNDKMTKAQKSRDFIKKVNRAKNQASDFKENPLYAKYYISESAIGLKKGEGYYQNILVVGNFFAYGVTDNFSISGGFETASLFQGNKPVSFINPKLSVHNIDENLHLAVGSFLSLNPGTQFNEPELGGSIYSTVTVGDKENNLSAGIGLLYVNDDFYEHPIFQIAGMTRLSKRFALVSEILFLKENSWEGVYTINLRIISGKAAFDIGVIRAVSGDGAIPVASAAIRF